MDHVAEVLQGAVVRLQHHGRLVVGQLPLRLRVNPAMLVVYEYGAYIDGSLWKKRAFG